MFDIGFSELLLVMIIGLVVLGPERLPIAVRTVAGWIRTLRSLASTVQNELSQELKLQELQDSLKKVEQASSLSNLSPELKASMDELKEAAEAMKRSYVAKPEHTVPVEQLNDPEVIYDGVVEQEETPVTPVITPPLENMPDTVVPESDKKIKPEQIAAVPTSQLGDDH
ncbi:Sec-independent protein translocase protein TatB [Pectobacteriaceae bacterium CE90]|nr:Sec-independent protein translocase protein TatB [Prodigiosinella sp. LS101]WJV54146.1 Sec-independent protein translocase protein TatB [Prodigiosinella sp. LS101]WJV58509.1 Sec-independent protein translocase protein TatB [Pectobacteriaceae bacterium C111]WJY14843.1 Sec-independent protein translocase protein TatB [Pectobacteriaceae bacterium CE90]